MAGQPYEIDLTRTARRALAERLPFDVVIGASGQRCPVADNPSDTARWMIDSTPVECARSREPCAASS